MKYFLFLFFIMTSVAGHCQVNIVERGFLYEGAIPPTCHAATLVESRSGDILAAFFGGTYEGHPDSDVWLCRFSRQQRRWSAPTVIADGVYTKYTRLAFDYDPLMPTIMHRDSMFLNTTWLKPAPSNDRPLKGNTVRKPCYNPVLYAARDGQLVLDYKIGSNMQDWTGWEIRSTDDGYRWTHPRPLTREPAQRHLRLGPIKNKPIVNGGRIIAGSSTEVTYDSWQVHFETSDYDGRTWQKRTVECDTILCIQPTILHLGGDHLKALCRTRHHRVAVTESHDNGTTWTPMRLTEMRHNNSGIDAVTARDGRHYLVANDTSDDARRSPLTLFRSDDGENWERLVDLEADDGQEYSYPAIIQTADGDLWIVYTWHRQRIAYVHIRL